MPTRSESLRLRPVGGEGTTDAHPSLAVAILVRRHPTRPLRHRERSEERVPQTDTRKVAAAELGDEQFGRGWGGGEPLELLGASEPRGWVQRTVCPWHAADSRHLRESGAQRQLVQRIPRPGAHRPALLDSVPGTAHDASLDTHQVLPDVSRVPRLAGGHAREASLVQTPKLGDEPATRFDRRSEGLFEPHEPQTNGISAACTSGRAPRNMTSSSSSTPNLARTRAFMISASVSTSCAVA